MALRADELPEGVESDRLISYARHVLGLAEALPADATALDLRLPFVEIAARFNEDAYAGYCAKSLASGSHPEPILARASLAVVDARAAGVKPPAAWWEDKFYPLDIEQRLAADGLQGSYFHDNNLWHVYDPKRHRGVQLLEGPGAYPPWERAAPLRPFLHWIYADLGMRLIHAGTLGTGGRGVLIAGAGGAGKSGTTLSGILAGLESVGDDYVLLRPGENGASLYPVFRVVKQDRAGFERLRLGRYIADPGELNWQGKYEFDFEDLGRGRRAPRLDLGAILVSRVTGGSRTEIVPIRQRDAMLALAPSGIFQMPGERRSGPAFFAAIIRSVPCFRLDLGADATEVGETIRAFAERLP